MLTVKVSYFDFSDPRAMPPTRTRHANFDYALTSVHPDSLALWDRDMGGRQLLTDTKWTVDVSTHSKENPFQEISVNFGNGGFCRFVNRPEGPKWIMIRESRSVISWEYFVNYPKSAPNHASPYEDIYAY